jgi:hypothetical protein
MTALQLTARISFALFLVAFTASAWARLRPRPWSHWLLRNRRRLGVAFALAHFVHGIVIVRTYGAGLFDERPPGPLATGFAVYLVIAALALTSNDRAVTWLGAGRWRLLHLAGIHVIWIAFLLAYLSKAVNDAIYALPVVLLVGALVLRLAARHSRA